MRALRPALGLVATIALTAACGDDEGGSKDPGELQGDECEEFSPCGGNIVGTWSFSGGCATLPSGFAPEIDDQSAFAACVSEIVPSIDIDLAGSATFGADGAFSVDQMSTVAIGFSVSQACLDRAANGMVDCASLGGQSSGGRCAINDSESSRLQSSGTYSTSGNSLTMMEAGSTDGPDQLDYCIRGDSMTVRLPMPNGTFTQWVARRQ